LKICFLPTRSETTFALAFSWTLANVQFKSIYSYICIHDTQFFLEYLKTNNRIKYKMTINNLMTQLWRNDFGGETSDFIIEEIEWLYFMLFLYLSLVYLKDIIYILCTISSGCWVRRRIKKNCGTKKRRWFHLNWVNKWVKLLRMILVLWRFFVILELLKKYKYLKIKKINMHFICWNNYLWSNFMRYELETLVINLLFSK